MTNRLATSSSPYLRQHAENPVDWWPWSDEAFAEARRRDVPVLISIGYSACHWCHVMAHESFADNEIAALVNSLVVPIKVDREERPDIDAVYLTATQLTSGQSGWPMTVFATPDGRPFHSGTYFRPEVFARLLVAIDQAWRDHRAELEAQADAVARALSGPGRSAGQPDPVPSASAPAGQPGVAPAERGMTRAALDAAASALRAQYDETHGGFDTAPKFPPHLDLLFLLRHHQRTQDPETLRMVRGTCAAMARGGIYDLLGGGFARYSVDERWTVPHFEKMLYDNALLLRVYTMLWRITGDPAAATVAAQTAAFLRDELRTAEGGFASALDADTDGQEGATYVWTPDQLRAVLGEVDGEWAAQLFGVTPEGTFERGTSVLRLTRAPGDEGRYARVRDTLLASRRHRGQPARDDKVVAAWNGLAITALVEYAMTAAAFGTSADWAGQLAVEAGELLARVHLVGGRLRRVSLGGTAGASAGVLDDHGLVAEAWCALHQYTADGRWLALAGDLIEVALVRFADHGGGFFDTADDAESLIARPSDPMDNPTPSGTSAIAAALITHAALSESQRYREAAERALATVAPLARSHGRFVGYACAAGEALLAGPATIAIVTSLGHADPLVATAWQNLPPGAVVVAGQPDQPGVPLLAKRPAGRQAATAYVCHGTVCSAPVSTEAELAGLLRSAPR